MSGCINGQEHVLARQYRSNELGRWRDCVRCHTTVLTPTFRYRVLLWRLRLRRRARLTFGAPVRR